MSLSSHPPSLILLSWSVFHSSSVLDACVFGVGGEERKGWVDRGAIKWVDGSAIGVQSTG